MDPTPAVPSPVPALSPGRERAVVLSLTFIQFAFVLDYVIMMPLGPVFLRTFDITPGQFGLMVSVYSIAAGISAFVTAPFVDRYERRTLLLVLFAGFTVGTALCGLAPGYGSLVAARIFTGIFGGVLGSTVMAAVGDIIPLSRRGAAIGLISSAFPIASVIGIPAGLWIVERTDWHVPFLVLAALCVPIIPVLARILPRRPPACSLPGAVPGRGFARLWRLASAPRHRAAFMVTVLIVTSGAIVIPYLSTYLVYNAGLPEADLAWVYLLGGGLTFFSMNLVGRRCDRYGRWNVLAVAAVVSFFTTWWHTHLPPSPIAVILLSSCLYMLGNTSRWVPASTIINGVPDEQDRGGFLAINNAVQSLFNGLGAYAGGWIAGEAASGQLARFGWNGWLSILLMMACVIVARPVDAELRSRSGS